MDESKLLKECVNINLTPLQTLLLSKTVIVVNELIKFLKANDCMEIERVTIDNFAAPVAEQTGHILIQSAMAVMDEVRDKLWENGRDEIGDMVPEELNDIVDVYATTIEQIAYIFIESLRER